MGASGGLFQSMRKTELKEICQNPTFSQKKKKKIKSNKHALLSFPKHITAVPFL